MAIFNPHFGNQTSLKANINTDNACTGWGRSPITSETLVGGARRGQGQSGVSITANGASSVCGHWLWFFHFKLYLFVIFTWFELAIEFITF